jgi:hypothetical protein
MSDPLFPAASDLTASILSRTSGPACPRLHALAWDLLAGQLAPDDQELAQQHLAYCPACQELLARLEAARQVLPGFADLDPGPAFTAAVLRRTCAVPPMPRRPPDPLVEGWSRLMRRPRAALEAAYLATAAGLILTQMPLPGSGQAAGPAFVGLIRQESRAPRVSVSALQQRWVRAQPAMGPFPRVESRWAQARRWFQRTRQTLAQAMRSLWEKVQGAASASSTEPSRPPQRPAP